MNISYKLNYRQQSSYRIQDIRSLGQRKYSEICSQILIKIINERSRYRWERSDDYRGIEEQIIYGNVLNTFFTVEIIYRQNRLVFSILKQNTSNIQRLINQHFSLSLSNYFFIFLSLSLIRQCNVFIRFKLENYVKIKHK